MWEKAQVAQEHKPVSSTTCFTNARHVQLPAIHALKQEKSFPL